MRLTRKLIMRAGLVIFVILLQGALAIGPNLRSTSAQGPVSESPFAAVNEPIGVAATPGRLYVTRPFCSTPENQTRQVMTIDSAGNASPFATLSPRVGCFEEYITVIPAPLDPRTVAGFPTPNHGFKSNFIYVTQGPDIVEVSPLDGSTKPFATLSSCPATHNGITFDNVGTFGFKLIVACSNGQIWLLNSSGQTVTPDGTSTSSPIATVTSPTAEVLGVVLPAPLASTITQGGAPNFADTYVTPYVARAQKIITSWKAQFVAGSLLTGCGLPVGIQLKVLRATSSNILQVVSAGTVHDPRPILQARFGGTCPSFQSGSAGSVIEFLDGLQVLPGDFIGVTIKSNPAVSGYFYTLVTAATTRLVLRDAAVGSTIDLTDPFTGTLPNLAPALQVNLGGPVFIEGPAVAPSAFAPFGGQLLVASETTNAVYPVSPSTSSVVSIVASVPTAEIVNFIPATQCNFAASGGAYFTAIFPTSIFTVPASVFAGLGDGRNALVPQEGGGITLLQSTTTTTGPIIAKTSPPFLASSAQHEGAAFVDCSVPRLLNIIVKPGSIPHAINTASQGTVAVAILSTPDFSALKLVQTKDALRFGFFGNEMSLADQGCTVEDVNLDGLPDLECHFNVQEMFPPSVTGIYTGPLILKGTYPNSGDPAGEGGG